MTTVYGCRADLDSAGFAHEQVVVRRGWRSLLPIIVAVHSTARGAAVGGCRLWRYDDWGDGLTDALRLSAGMSDKCAVAGLRHGGGKTVVALPPGRSLEPCQRRELFHDVADTLETLDSRYLTGPDVGTTPQDMATIAERSSRVFCQPREYGGSGDSSPHTATGIVSCLHTLCDRLDGHPRLEGRRIAVIGLGHVGQLVARELAAAGADLSVTDIEPARRRLASELGARCLDPADALTAEADVLVPAALSGQFTDAVVPQLRCRAILGPANNQLAHEHLADRLHERGIVWAPDYLVSAGGIVYATATEIDHLAHDQALARVRHIATTLLEVLRAAERGNRSPHHSAQELIHSRTDS